MPPEVPGYALHEVVGRGPAAIVYRATQTSVDRPVAVKLMAPDAARVGRAGRVLAGHPHVVEVIDTGTTAAGEPFVAMELVAAGSLGDRLRAFGPLGAGEVARLGAEVADALEAAHDAGLGHGAISPDNVLVGRRGQALLTDFGGGRATPADDVRALGATLFALLTGDPPPAGEAPPLPPDVPFALVDVIASSTAHDPAARPSLAAMATALEAIAADRARPPASVAVPDPADEPGPPGSPEPGGDDTMAAVNAPAPHPNRSPSPLPMGRMIVVSVLIALSIIAAVVVALVFG